MLKCVCNERDQCFSMVGGGDGGGGGVWEACLFLSGLHSLHAEQAELFELIWHLLTGERDVAPW